MVEFCPSAWRVRSALCIAPVVLLIIAFMELPSDMFLLCKIIAGREFCGFNEANPCAAKALDVLLGVWKGSWNHYEIFD